MDARIDRWLSGKLGITLRRLFRRWSINSASAILRPASSETNGDPAVLRLRPARQPIENTEHSTLMSTPVSDTTPFTSAILLAAGVSRRMGTLKALLDWQGRPLIMHQIVALREAGADEVVVVLGHRADELQARIGANRDVYNVGNVRCVINSAYAEGKTTSIKTGLRGISDDLGHTGPILMLNVDQPRSAGLIRKVLDSHNNGDGALITIPACQGKGGHPIAISRTLHDELLEITEATQGIRAVVMRHLHATQRMELGAPELLWDVNTPEQYRAALAESGFTVSG